MSCTETAYAGVVLYGSEFQAEATLDRHVDIVVLWRVSWYKFV